MSSEAYGGCCTGVRGGGRYVDSGMTQEAGPPAQAAKSRCIWGLPCHLPEAHLSPTWAVFKGPRRKSQAHGAATQWTLPQCPFWEASEAALLEEDDTIQLVWYM